jgi:aldose 1-epimerase
MNTNTGAATRTRLPGVVCLLAMTISPALAQYAAERAQVDGVDIVRLMDRSREVEVAIAPSAGNMAYEMKVKGVNVFWTPPSMTLAQMRERKSLSGNPVLAPFANRIDGGSYWANGKKYLLNFDIGNLRRDQNGNAIHGMLGFSDLWEVTALEADSQSAWATSRLEFWKHPELMAQFPFAHTMEITYQLRNGVLEVATMLKNHSGEPMPVGIGYHPYFAVHDAPRDEWTVRLPVKEKFVLSPKLIPTGERQPAGLEKEFALGGVQLDDVFGGLVRESDGRAAFWVKGKNQRILVHYGPKYTVAVVYAPPGRNFICFEPMAAITNAFNLAQDGKYNELQSVPPGGEWKESFWIEASGF